MVTTHRTTTEQQDRAGLAITIFVMATLAGYSLTAFGQPQVGMIVTGLASAAAIVPLINS